MLIGEKPPKLDEKTRRKTRSLIDEKPPKLNKKTRKKTDHFVALWVLKNLQNLAKKTKKKTRYYLKIKTSIFGSTA